MFRSGWLCRYGYDPLDRLAGRLTAEPDNERCFYQSARLTTRLQGPFNHSWLQTPTQLFAQHHRGPGKNDCVLITSDQAGSVLHCSGVSRQQHFTYTPYGSRHPEPVVPYLPGFNHEQPDPVTGHYLLGNGYRAYNPLLMRFNSADSLSPFGKGGLNGYAYCAGDPVNRTDAQGHAPKLLASLRKLVRKRSPRRASAGGLADDTVTALPSASPSGTPAVETSGRLVSTPASARPDARHVDTRHVNKVMSALSAYQQRGAVVPPTLMQKALRIPQEQQHAWRANQIRQSSSQPQALPPAYSELDLPPPYSERDPLKPIQ